MQANSLRNVAMTITTLALATLIAAFGQRALAQANAPNDGPAFPVPRAEKEFAALVPDLQKYCDSAIKGDTKAFILNLSIYSPLDLEVRQAKSPAEAGYLRNFHIGVAAAMSEMPSDLAGHLGQPFLHSPTDIQTRKQRLVKELPQIAAFVKRFQTLPQITLLAQWGFAGEYRVNDTFHMASQTKEAIPSSIMGFVPSGKWKTYKTTQEYLDTIHVSKPAFDALYAAFQPLFLTAVHRTKDGVTEVIGLGFANNTSGLLFVPAAHHPALGQRTPSGATYSVVEQINPGILYFETN